MALGYRARGPRARESQRPDSRLPSLTGLRFVAALSVFGFHLYVVGLFGGSTQHTLSWLLGPGGGVGVSFFFILSGFVLAWSVRATDTARKFLRRRFFKIWPAHFVVWLLVAVILVAIAAAPTLFQALTSLFLVQAWVPKSSVFFAVNSPSWSLSVEAAFYVTFPLLWAWVSRIRAERLWTWSVGMMAAVWCVPLLALALPASGPAPAPLHHISDLQFWFIYIFPATRFPEFILGMLLVRIVREGRWIKLGLWPASALAVAGYFVSAFVPPQIGLVAVSVVPLALLIPAVATADVAGARTPWRNRVMVWLGETSYCFYLIHQLVLQTGKSQIGLHKTLALGPGIGYTLYILASTIIEARILYWLVEKPSMRWFAVSRRDRAARLAAQQAAAQPVAQQPAAAHDAVLATNGAATVDVMVADEPRTPQPAGLPSAVEGS
ncbi:MAG TPA: acyltransferase [Streptosporangiaceae bacterium]|nr:acyltransferase [Streptosporangiaceae bacterium]